MEKRTVMVVDDEELVEEMIESFLTKRGYQSVSFTDPEDAIRFFQKNPEKIDLVITDLKMPEVSGKELARRVFRVDKSTPVILITGFLEQSMDGVPNIKRILEKPVTRTELLAAVEETVGSSTMSRGQNNIVIQE